MRKHKWEINPRPILKKESNTSRTMRDLNKPENQPREKYSEIEAINIPKRNSSSREDPILTLMVTKDQERSSTDDYLFGS
jgi:hypothetical protein